MSGLALVLLSIGGLLCLIAWIWLVVTAFRVGIGWGLLILLLSWLLIPVAVFAVKFWDRARRPVLLYAFGIALNAAAYLVALAAVGAGIDDIAAPASALAPRPVDHGADDDAVLPTPRPAARPTHPSWEAIVEEISEESASSWEELVPTTTPATNRPDRLSWNELNAHIGRTIVIELEHGAPVTATLEGAEEHRVRIRHVIGGGEASYWVERDSVALIRLAD